jgi:hypothetical protein
MIHTRQRPFGVSTVHQSLVGIAAGAVDLLGQVVKRGS